MNRFAVKIAGESGQGINSIGEIVAKGLKRAGYCVFGYREYPSLIKGGHASYQIDVSPDKIRSSASEVDAVMNLGYEGITMHLNAIKRGGYLIHDIPDLEFNGNDSDVIKNRSINVIFIPTVDILKQLNAPLVLQNIIFTGFLWAAMGMEASVLKQVVEERFSNKQKLIGANIKCMDAGYGLQTDAGVKLNLPKPANGWKDHMLITGNQAIGLGALHAGVRMFVSYPMTPASSLLSYLASAQKETGMVIKQAEDEITAAQMSAGAYFMGTRAMTGTSGGGFDLMTETLSMVGAIESPMVFVLAQRPGPATGIPTWTAQGDLFLAVNAGHGEFPRCVVSVSDAEDAFKIAADSHNIAERFQIPVILMTDKHVAECLFTVGVFDQEEYEINRGKLTDKVSENAARFAITDDGVSERWLPGLKNPGYNATSYENLPDGTITEDGIPAKAMFEKRMKKMSSLESALPEPELFGSQEPEILAVGWGSTKGAVLDALCSCEGRNVGYLHYSYLWPLKTGKFVDLHGKAGKTILVEGNYQGQLGMLIKQQTGIDIGDKVLRYDGRPFFYEEICHSLTEKVQAANP